MGGEGQERRGAPVRWTHRLVRIGASPSDPEELRLRKSVLVLSTALMAGLSCIWVATYALLGLRLSAAIPFAYQLASVAGLALFARSGRYELFRTAQLCMSLLLPFALQWSLGGFEAASVVSLWGLTSPLGALLFVGARESIPWFIAFLGLIGLSAAIDPVIADHAADIPQGLVIAFFALNVTGVATTAYVLLQYFVRAREHALADSERLLLNVLPAPIVARLKREEVVADHAEATVLFADIVGFTPLAGRLPAPALVSLLDRVFARWDALAAELGVEKIKTIGDEYMAAAGIPRARPDHAEAVAQLALAMGPALEACAGEAGISLAARIGVDSGPVVAGVIGRSRLTYDLWGDTVNTASRMESHAPPGAIQVTERVRELLRGSFAFEPRGPVEVKGKGPMVCYLLAGRRPSG